jgi:BirA family biotin operon repressor/biotin-[acetyl-CoA-carboxylase] ligase
MIPADSPALPGPEDLMASLRAALPQFRQIEWFERIDSTNANLLTKVRTSSLRLDRPWLLGAHLQEQGRGRAGRTWQNRSGANLMFSCAFDIFLPTRSLPTLSPLVGVAACEALRDLLPTELKSGLTLKWPNDLQWKFAKLGGILVESTRAGTSQLSTDHHVAIIGIGLNLNDARALSQSLDRQIADWREIDQQAGEAMRVSAATLVTRIAGAWYDTISSVVRQGFVDLPERFANVDALSGQHVNILDDGRVAHSGIACGVNETGQLLIRRPQGGQLAVSVGDVSVRRKAT